MKAGKNMGAVALSIDGRLSADFASPAFCRDG